MMKISRSFRKDLPLYVAISTLIIGVIFALFAAGMSWDFFVKYVGLGIATAVLFSYFILDSRLLLRKRLFWILCSFLFVIHCAAWMAVLIRVEHWKFIWFYPVLIELVSFQFFRIQLQAKLLDTKRTTRRTF
jgi:hypothetical protein